MQLPFVPSGNKCWAIKYLFVVVSMNLSALCNQLFQLFLYLAIELKIRSDKQNYHICERRRGRAQGEEVFLPPCPLASVCE